MCRRRQGHQGKPKGGGVAAPASYPSPRHTTFTAGMGPQNGTAAAHPDGAPGHGHLPGLHHQRQVAVFGVDGWQHRGVDRQGQPAAGEQLKCCQPLVTRELFQQCSPACSQQPKPFLHVLTAGGVHGLASVQLGMEQQATAAGGRRQQCAAHIQGAQGDQLHAFTQQERLCRRSL